MEPLSFSDPPRLLGDYARGVLQQLKPGAAGSVSLRPDRINDLTGMTGQVRTVRAARLASRLPGPPAQERHGYLDLSVKDGVPQITVNVWIEGDGVSQAQVVEIFWREAGNDQV
jgi:hypothetical protein